jgi:hypothetical protein
VGLETQVCELAAVKGKDFHRGLERATRWHYIALQCVACVPYGELKGLA